MVLSARYRHIFRPYLERVARFVTLHPNAITILSLVFAGIAAYYYANQMWLVGSVVAVVAGILDAIDGAVARYWKKESKWGAYLDAITDRYVEGILLFGIGLGSSAWVVVYPIIFASLMISYAKARAAMETKVDNINWPDLFERAERLILLIVGTPIAAATGYLFEYLLVLAVLFNLGVFQRIARVKRRLEGKEH